MGIPVQAAGFCELIEQDNAVTLDANKPENSEERRACAVLRRRNGIPDELREIHWSCSRSPEDLRKLIARAMLLGPPHINVNIETIHAVLESGLWPISVCMRRLPRRLREKETITLRSSS